MTDGSRDLDAADTLRRWLFGLPPPRLSPRVRLRRSAIHGMGLHAREDLAAGELLMTCHGEEVPEPVLDALVLASGIDVGLCVGFGRYVVYGPTEGSAYINHACRPNAGLAGAVTFVAIQDVARDQELFIDYGTFESCPTWRMDCACGAPGCRGVVTGADHLLPDLQARLSPWFSPYLRAHLGYAARMERRP